MHPISSLTPNHLWKCFDDICKIPRPSQKEERIIDYLLNWAKENSIEARKDKIGNIVMTKSATLGFENLQPVVLQSHMDMVCDKNDGVQYDCDNDPVQPLIEGDWVKAKGTTLGADNGIGMAAQLAILKAEGIQHGPIECLFTVDEELGLTGAAGLENAFIESKILLNLDSEDEGEIFIGCAGGIDTSAIFAYTPVNLPDSHIAYRLDIKGLQGGHSGDDIHRGLGNSNKILNSILWYASQQYDLGISLFEGGGHCYSIPREAYAIVTIPLDNKGEFERTLQKKIETITDEFAHSEPYLSLSYEQTSKPQYLIDIHTQEKFLEAIRMCPHGVFAMSKEVTDLVETSSNLASVKFLDNYKIEIATSQRSSVDSSIGTMAKKVADVFELANFKVKHSGAYPGWSPNFSSTILDIAISSYEQLYGYKPAVKAVHAGLECGLFLEKYPELDMISFGPTIRGAHSPDEKVFIPSVLKWWNHLLHILVKVPVRE